MNKIGEKQIEDILNSFFWDSTGYPESSGIRAREREDSHIFYNRDWFNIVTAKGWREETNRLRTYQRGFAPKLNKFDELGRVSLCDFSRQSFEETPWKERPQYLAKLFDLQKYTREQREQYLLNYCTSNHWPNSAIKKFLDIYFDIEVYSGKEREQFLAKCYEQNERKKQQKELQETQDELSM